MHSRMQNSADHDVAADIADKLCLVIMAKHNPFVADVIYGILIRLASCSPALQAAC